MAEVLFEHVDKVFPGGTRAVADLSLRVGEGQLVVLLGPSGCGKSTLLRLVAGLEAVSAGDIRIGGRRVNELGPGERDVAMVFQSYALYPHMTVRANLEFPLRMRGYSRGARARKVQETARTLGITELLERRPDRLSGGQAQRVAMGRALVREPAVFLMDEPLSNLDAKLRVQIRREIAALHARLGTTTLYVTHDQVEAMTLGQRVAVLRGGALQQVAAPQALYEQPANVFVAGFVGRPPMTVLQARATRDGAGPTLALGERRIALPASAAPPPQARMVGIRPESFAWPEAAPERPRLRLEVASVELLGDEQIVYAPAPVPVIDPDAGAKPAPLAPEQSYLAARLPAERRVRAGDTVALALDPEALRWFDEEGRALARCPGPTLQTEDDGR